MCPPQQTDNRSQKAGFFIDIFYRESRVIYEIFLQYLNRFYESANQSNSKGSGACRGNRRHGEKCKDTYIALLFSKTKCSRHNCKNCRPFWQKFFTDIKLLRSCVWPVHQIGNRVTQKSIRCAPVSTGVCYFLSISTMLSRNALTDTSSKSVMVKTGLPSFSNFFFVACITS